MNKIYIAAALLMTLTASCGKFEHFQKDPNRPVSVTPDLLLTQVEEGAFQVITLDATLATRQMIYTNGVSDNQYYGWTRSDFNTYDKLRQVQKMQEEAVAYGKPEYLPLAKFFKCWYYLQLTNTFGDIPFSQALQGGQENLTPVYDQQQDIYAAILDSLKDANAAITSTTAAVQGDVVYSGSMTQWKQLINSLSLRVLMSLSLKTGNTTLNVKQRFADIVTNPATYPIMGSNADNGQLKFYDVANNRYPLQFDNDLQTAYYMEENFINLLKNTQDPRLFRFAEKAPKDTSLPDGDFAAYGGVQGSAPLDVNNTRIVNGEASRIKARYYLDPVNEPSVGLGYPEVQFILAEGAQRGWITTDAATYYQKGVTASMQFYNVPQDSIDIYLKKNPYPATNSLAAIMTQKYVASFLSGGWNFFYDQRRTGLPVFDVSGGGVVNNGKVPKRWMYPESELQLNRKNVNDAISRQYPDGDNVNGVMWLLKQE